MLRPPPSRGRQHHLPWWEKDQKMAGKRWENAGRMILISLFSHVFTCFHMFSHVFTALDQCSNIKWKIMTETDNIFIAGLLKTEIPQCQARLLEGHQRSRWPIKRVPHVKVRNIHHDINIIQLYRYIYNIFSLKFGMCPTTNILWPYHHPWLWQ